MLARPGLEPLRLQLCYYIIIFNRYCIMLPLSFYKQLYYYYCYYFIYIYIYICLYVILGCHNMTPNWGGCLSLPPLYIHILQPSPYIVVYLSLPIYTYTTTTMIVIIHATYAEADASGTTSTAASVLSCLYLLSYASRFQTIMFCLLCIYFPFY